MPGPTASRLLPTYASLPVVLSAGVAALGADVRKFAFSFAVVFAIARASWIAGSNAYVAAITSARHASRRTLRCSGRIRATVAIRIWPSCASRS
jgi:hypothetical protein